MPIPRASCVLSSVCDRGACDTWQRCQGGAVANRRKNTWRPRYRHVRLAGNAGCKKIAVWVLSHNFVGLYILPTKACIDNRKKNLLSSNISSTCPHNIVNFGLLAAEIVSLVWATQLLASLLQRRRSTEANQTLHGVWPSPGLVHYVYNFGVLVHYRILPGSKFTLHPPSLGLSYFGSVTARHLSMGAIQTAALSTGRHLYLAGRPSRWALAHIVVFCNIWTWDMWHVWCVVEWSTITSLVIYSPLFSPYLYLFINMLFDVGSQFNELYASLACERLQFYVLSFFAEKIGWWWWYWWVSWWKKFENRLRFDRVITMSLMSSFFELSVYSRCI